MSKNSSTTENNTDSHEISSIKDTSNTFNETKDYTFDIKCNDWILGMQTYNNLCHNVHKLTRQKLADIDKEIDEIFSSGKVNPKIEEIRKKKRRGSDKLFFRQITPLEATEDLNEIRGIKNVTYVSASNGILKVQHSEFRKRDNVEVDMHGENFKATLMSISPSNIVLRAKNGKKYSIQIKSIKKEDVKLIKAHK